MAILNNSEDYSFRNTVFYLINHIEKLYDDVFIERIKPLRLSTSKWRVLAICAEFESLTISELSEESCVNRTALWHVLEAMEGEGLIARRHRAADLRVTEVSLTDAGTALYRELVPVKIEIFEGTMDGVSREKKAAFIEVLEAMQRNLREMERAAV